MNIPTVIVLILIAAAVAGAAIHMARNKNSCGSCGGCGSYERCSRCKKLEYILNRPCRDYYRAGQIAYAESLTADMVIYWSI